MGWGQSSGGLTRGLLMTSLDSCFSLEFPIIS
jgi:hypothetical protein